MNRLALLAVLTFLSVVVLSRASVADGPANPLLLYPSPSTQPADPPARLRVAPRADLRQYKLIRGREGYWRLAQTHEGVWWFLSPDGQRQFLNGVTTATPFQLGRDLDGPGYLSRDWSGKPDDADLDAWAAATLLRIRAAGFKSLGAWCNPAFHKLDMPMSRDLNVSTWMVGAAVRFYSPDWAVVAERVIRTQTQPLVNNRNLIGYYIDNELDWGDSGMGPAWFFDHLAPADPNRRQVMRIIRKVWADVNQFNTDWKAELADWPDLDQWKALPSHESPAYGRLFSAWLSHLAGDYFRLTTALIRKHDPNHLILGVRFKGQAPAEVARAGRGHTDAQSINYYAGDARLDEDLFSRLHELSDQPIIISEYSFHALDGRSGNRNTFGFDAQVLDQQARADGYYLFTTRAARIPYVVGTDWFQWADEPPAGRTSDGEDVNFGVVDIDDREYELLAESIRKTTPLLNGLHERSAREEPGDAWRESFADKPVANVPFLGKAPRLNGELSDWPAPTRLAGIRHSQTVGLERSRVPVPNVHLGWTYEGLYVGLEVFDKHIQTTPPKGAWWTRDHVEFWVSTRPVASDQNAFNEYSHQFFFVPLDAPAEGRYSGYAGQWHRVGDALKEHLVPHPSIKSVARILPDRYVVEMFIPAKALNGYDPKHQPALAFNLHVRNYQEALDYFWSAPKEVRTHLRPNTWGPMYLEAPKNAQARADRNEQALAR